ncbi:MAG: hypothetical protein AAGU12_07085 [Clostridiales bacterium]
MIGVTNLHFCSKNQYALFRDCLTFFASRQAAPSWQAAKPPQTGKAAKPPQAGKPPNLPKLASRQAAKPSKPENGKRKAEF